MLRGTEISKMDSEIISNYDDKKTILSSYLIKQLIAKNKPASSGGMNSVVSEQEMWTISASTISETSIFEQEEGITMQPIKFSTGNIEETFNNVILENVILNVEGNTITANRNWSFNEVKDYYTSTYKNFSDVSKIGLLVVDASHLQTSEINIPALVKINDSHYFVPVALKTPTINKNTIINGSSILIFNPKITGNIYLSNDLGVSNEISSLEPSNFTIDYNVIIDEKGKIQSDDTKTISNVNITEPTHPSEYNTIKYKNVLSGNPKLYITNSDETLEPINVNSVSYDDGTAKSFEIIHKKEYEFIKDGDLVMFFDNFNVENIKIDDVEQPTSNYTVYPGNDSIIIINNTETIHANKIETSTTTISVYKNLKPININIRVSQFASHEPVVSIYPSKLTVETLNYNSNPSAFISENEIIYSSSYIDHLTQNALSFPVPKYFVTVCFEKLDNLYLTLNNVQKPMILNREATVIVPKDSKITVNYLQMYQECKFNIFIFEEKYFDVIDKGILENPVNRYHYVNMEDYMMDLPYRDYNNLLSDTLFSRTYENYDQTYKLQVVKDYQNGTFHYIENVKPLRKFNKYYIATTLTDENQNVLTLDRTQRLQITVENDITIKMHDSIEGFDIYGTSNDAKPTIEIPYLDLSKDIVYINNSNVPLNLNIIDDITIKCGNFKNYFDEYTETGDVQVDVESERGIAFIPIHIHSSTNQTIPATIKIEESAILPELKTDAFRDSMKTFFVKQPFTLFTLGESGWFNEYYVPMYSGYSSLYIPYSNTLTPKNIFSKVLIPKNGLANFATKESEWRMAFAHSLRLVYPFNQLIEQYSLDITYKKYVRGKISYTGDYDLFTTKYLENEGLTTPLVPMSPEDFAALGFVDPDTIINAIYLSYIEALPSIFGSSTELINIIDFY